MVAAASQQCPTLCHPMNNSLPGSSVHGILLARILEWGAISYSRGSSQPRDQTQVSYISCAGRQLLYHQHHLGRLLRPWDSPGTNTGVGCHFLCQGTFPTQGSNPCLLSWQAGSLPLSHQGNPFFSPGQYFSGCCCEKWPQGDSICSFPAGKLPEPQSMSCSGAGNYSVVCQKQQPAARVVTSLVC